MTSGCARTHASAICVTDACRFFRDIVQHASLGQACVIDGAIRHGGHFALAHPGQEFVFGTAPRDVVENLIRGALVAVREREELDHVGGIEVAHAPVADLTLRLELFEAVDDLFEVFAAAPVEQVHVDVIGVQPFQAAIAGGFHACLAAVVRIDLADEEECFPARLRRSHHFRDEFFAVAIAVHFGGIKEGEALLQAGLERFDFGCAGLGGNRPFPRFPGRGSGLFHLRGVGWF